MNSLDDLLQSASDAAHRVLSAICQAQDTRGLLPLTSQGDGSIVPVVVGFSGGADSVCLLHALSTLAPHWNLTLHAVHLDHALRGESAADAAFAANFAAELGVTFHVHRLDPGQLSDGSANVEAAARAARYTFLAQVARRVAAPHLSPTVAVAQHMDDQAETLLMNLVRGSGLRGLGGMPWSRELDVGHTDPNSPEPSSAVRIVRPLLGVRRTVILDYLHAFGLQHIEDPTNRDTARLRNRLRHGTLPALAELNPAIVETLARTADVLATEADRAGSLDRAALDELTIEALPPLRYVLDFGGLLRLHPASQRGVLRIACERMQLDVRDLGFVAIDDVLQRLAMSEEATGSRTWAEGVDWSMLPADSTHPALFSLHRRDTLPYHPSHPLLHNLRPEVTLPTPIRAPQDYAVTPHWSLHASFLSPSDLPSHWDHNADPWCAFLDADRVPSPLLTTPSPGMHVAPLGMSGQRKGLGDYFTDRKTPRAFRGHWPVVVDEGDGAVVWLCGHTIAHNVRITERTRRVLLLEWHRTDASPHFPAAEERLCAQM